MQLTVEQQTIPFFLNPRNQDFFYGRVTYLVPSWGDQFLFMMRNIGWVALSVGPLVLVIGLPMLHWGEPIGAVIGFGLIILAPIVRILGYRLFILLCILGSRGLVDKGRIVMGTLTHITGTDIAGDEGIRSDYEIDVQFTFETGLGGHSMPSLQPSETIFGIGTCYRSAICRCRCPVHRWPFCMWMTAIIGCCRTILSATYFRSLTAFYGQCYICDNKHNRV